MCFPGPLNVGDHTDAQHVESKAVNPADVFLL